MKQKIERSEIRLRRTKTIYVVMSICLISLISNPTSCSAQNLVPNPSFEAMSNCSIGSLPCSISGASSIQYGCVTSWQRPGTVATTPDGFNSCAGNSVSTPSNYFGTESPNSGDGYAGIFTFSNDWCPGPFCNTDYREYVQAQLTSPLAASTTYTISFYASCAEGSISGSTVIGVSTKVAAYISATAAISSGAKGLIAVTPTVISASTIDAKVGWTLVTGTFASGGGGQQWITIGNFNDDGSTILGNGGVTATTHNAYYYIDDVCVTPVGGTGCGSFGLPISLLTFTASCQATPNTVRVAWSTATETNNDYFTIERAAPSNSPKGGGLNWEVAGTVKGAGNSSSTLNYEFTDNFSAPNSELPTLYYRLKQTDFDGKTETFNNKQIAVDVTECAVKVFPNPAGNTLNIPYTAEQDGEITLQVYDVIGKLVKQKLVVAVKGNNKFTMDLSTVAQGMYVLRVKGGAKENNQKFVKQ